MATHSRSAAAPWDLGGRHPLPGTQIARNRRNRGFPMQLQSGAVVLQLQRSNLEGGACDTPFTKITRIARMVSGVIQVLFV